MKLLITDVETTSKNKGHPFDPENRMLFAGCYDGTSLDIYDIEYSGRPYGGFLSALRARVDEADLLVGFAYKFDLHWKRRYGIGFQHKKILDLQAAEFILSGQTSRMPSLDDCLARRGLPLKVPFDFTVEHSEAEWRHYLEGDLKSEYALALAVLEDLDKNPLMKRLVFDDSQDILITADMEWNGMKYDLEKSIEIGNSLNEQIRELDYSLSSLGEFSGINFGSGEQLSAVLYGGVTRNKVREKYSRTLKDGTVRERERWGIKEVEYPRLVEPLDNTKLEKDGYFQTGEGILLKLKAKGLAKDIIQLVLQRTKLEKKVGTYYHGIPELYKEMGWQDSLLHGQLHHCVARTGRLSSSGPNLQNIEDGVRSCLITRY